MRHKSVVPRCAAAGWSLAIGLTSMAVLLGVVFSPFSPLHTPASIAVDHPKVVSAGPTSMHLPESAAWLFDKGFQRKVLILGLGLPMLTGLIAGIMGIRAMSKIERANGGLSGDGPATFGVLSGMFSLVVGLVSLWAVSYHQL